MALALLVLIGIALEGRAQEPRHAHFKEPHSTQYLISLETNKPNRAAWVLAQRPGSRNPVEIGHRVVLQIEPGVAIADLPIGPGLKLSRTINPNLFIFEAGDAISAIDAAEALAGAKGVVASYPVMRRAFRLHNGYGPAPNDSYFAEQWHLENRGPDGNLIGPDFNVRAAWPAALGNGILVAVADTGFQLDHPELINRASGGPHFNFFENTSDGGPYDSQADHGTAVAGLIAAEQNNHRGVSGLAPQAKLASWVIFGFSDLAGGEVIASDEQLMEMFQYASNRVDVQNHSWGNGDVTQSAMDSLSDTGISNAVTFGRAGKGVVIVRAAGNNRADQGNANDDAFASDPRAIAVAAIRKDGLACSYSNPGACVLVGAPSAELGPDINGDGVPDVVDPVYTTDRTGDLGYTPGTDDRADYTGFDGTSASSPQIAGVAALILSANTNLAYRDVQQILALSSRHFGTLDPDVLTNGAGLRFSHNAGFGVPDAAFAIQLAKSWSNRPPTIQATVQNTSTLGIPDDGLRVICTGTGLGSTLTNIHCLPSSGPHPDDPTSGLSLVYLGQALTNITQDLHGKGALIQRGVSLFSDKIARAAKAGATFAVIFNNTGTTEIQPMGGTDFVPIPAVAIGRVSGEALRDFLATHPETTGRLQLSSAVTRISITNTLICERVGVRLMTTHQSRGDIRITLVSPMGSRSVLQAINEDTFDGLSDWTYWSAKHLYESSAGEWRVEVSDEQAADVGSVTYVQLIVKGMPILDTDHDGLDDNWERRYFGNLSSGPKDDPDGDGFNNAREQAMGTDPSSSSTIFRIDIAVLKPGYSRLSWPARDTASYTLFSGTNAPQPFGVLTNLPGRLPVKEFVVPDSAGPGFFRVRQDIP